ncbi:MAG: DUF5131 family protein [Micavibrio sp.]|nr:DUF5131 family protein [Micavibrio sp.]
MTLRRNLDWLLLTKRPENVRRMWSWRDNGDNPNLCENWSKRRDNAWLGTSIACQEDANRNIQELLKCRDLAAKIFLSIEPLIEPVDFRLVPGFNKCGQAGQDIVRNLWVIVGGESGPNARPCDVAWIRSIVGQCHNAGVPCFVKQVGSMCIDNDAASRCHWPPLTEFHQNNERCRVLQKHPKGGDPAEWPEDIRVRKVPS